METYKINIPDIEINHEDPFNSKFLGTQHEVDTGIPQVLLNTVREALKTLPKELIVTPVMINPVDMGVYFGIIEQQENGHLVKKYSVEISKLK